MISFILGLLAGVAMPVQTSVNGKLRDSLRSPYFSSIISFSGGFICAVIVLLCVAGSLYVPFGKVAMEPLWIWTGGFCGSILVVISIFCIPKLGSVETMVMLVLGQIGIGLVIDNFGLFESDVIALTPAKLIGAVLVLGGTVMVSMSNSSSESVKSNKGNSIWIYRIGEIIAGILAGLQVAINGRLGQITGSAFSATMISMATGTLGVIIIAIIVYLIGGKKLLIPDKDNGVKTKWWMWTGGAFGMVIVGGNALIAKPLGTGLSVILNVVGQTFGGIVLDAIGFLGIDKKPVTLVKVAGVLIMNVGIVLVSLF